MSRYLDAKRTEFEALRSSIDGLQERAVNENRDLTDEELRSAEQMGESAKALAKEIENLSQVENLRSVVGAVQAEVVERSATTAVDRDPGHYRSVEDGGTVSFFGDMYRAQRQGDRDALDRIAEHNRALSTGAGGEGIVAPKWLSDRYEPLARQGRVLANAVVSAPLSDANPFYLPKQTAGTDAVVGVQASENTAPTETDAFDTAFDTITPKTITGAQVFSRQALVGSTPAMDGLIMADLMSVYGSKVEAQVAAALHAVGTALAAGDDLADVVIDAALAVRSARKLPATLLLSDIAGLGVVLKLKDADGRPLVPQSVAGQAVNVLGVGNVNASAILSGLPMIVSDAQTANEFTAFRASDVVLFESPVQSFRFEEVSGPESIKLAVWGYAVTSVRYAPGSVKRITYTAPVG